MSEEIKEILEELKNDINIKENWQYVNDYYVEDMRNLLDYIEDLKQKVEQLEKENKRLKEWKDDLLSENIELENIRKEAIDKLYCWGEMLDAEFQKSMLNTLNKGSEPNE